MQTTKPDEPMMLVQASARLTNGRACASAAMNARRDDEIALQQLQALVDAQTANPDAKIIVLGGV